jgi:hypothetical protein
MAIFAHRMSNYFFQHLRITHTILGEAGATYRELPRLWSVLL